jgi:hypothetical protein
MSDHGSGRHCIRGLNATNQDVRMTHGCLVNRAHIQQSLEHARFLWLSYPPPTQPMTEDVARWPISFPRSVCRAGPDPRRFHASRDMWPCRHPSPLFHLPLSPKLAVARHRVLRKPIRGRSATHSIVNKVWLAWGTLVNSDLPRAQKKLGFFPPLSDFIDKTKRIAI